MRPQSTSLGDALRVHGRWLLGGSLATEFLFCTAADGAVARMGWSLGAAAVATVTFDSQRQLFRLVIMNFDSRSVKKKDSRLELLLENFRKVSAGLKRKAFQGGTFLKMG